MDTSLDPTVVNLAKAIRQTESGGNFAARGKSGEMGAYQFTPDTWNATASKYGIKSTLDKATPEEQNAVAYNRIKAWKDAGHDVTQIASMWNAGEGEPNAYTGKFGSTTPTHTAGDASVGTNKYGAKYSVPDYAKSVSQAYLDIKNGGTVNADPNNPSSTANVQNQQTPAGQTPNPDMLQKVGNVVNAIFPGKQVGDLIGSLYDKMTLPKEQADLIELPDSLSVVADLAQMALMVGAGPGVGAAGSTAARIGVAGAEGAAFGGLNAVAGGSRDLGEIGKDAAIGGVLGAGTAGLVEGGMAAYKGLKGLSRGARTAEEILMTPESEVGKLSARDQQFWHQNAATESISKARLAGEQSLAEADKALVKGQQELGNMTKETAETYKEPAQKLLKTQGQEYVALTGEAAQNSPALSKTITTTELSNKIDSKFEYNPEIAASLKNDLGIKPPAAPVEGVVAPEVKLTNQEILDKARAIMQEVSKGSRQGNKVYSSAEYQAMQKYSFLMEALGDNGVDMKAANEFWKKWAPLRDKIVTQVKPWDETGIKGTPLSRTMLKATQEAKTSVQAISKSDAKEFIGQFEKALKLEPGSMTKSTQDLVDQLAASKLSKEQLAQANKEALAQLRQDIKNKKFDLSTAAKKAARLRTIIGKIIKVGAGVVIGGQVGGVAGEAVGAAVGMGL